MQALLAKGRIKPRFPLRLVVLCVSSIIYLVYRLFYPTFNDSCLRDHWHEFTAPLNIEMNNQLTSDIVIGIGQVFMDSWIVTICIFWIVKLKHTSIAFSAALFYLTRSIIMQLVAFPFPPNYVWHSPGFYSLTVPYDHTRDFYFSGHTGSLTVIMLEFSKAQYRWVTLIVLICLIYMMNMLTITRVHYTVDIAGGLIFGFFWHSVVNKNIYYFDWLASLPYFLVKKLVNRYKKPQILQQSLIQSIDLNQQMLKG